MKILLQDRKKIVEMPREIWETQYGDAFGIVGTSYISPLFGLYATEQRAKEVLSQIFEYYRNGKNSYVMPEQ